MAWVFFRAVSGHEVHSQNFGIECWNAWDYFWAIPRLMSLGFVVCFGVWGCFWPELDLVKWTKPGLVQGVLRLDDALLN